MSYIDRLQTAAYTAPSGNRFEFIYENVSVEVDKKTVEFTFLEKDGAYIQDLGRAGRRFPFTLFFSGEDYDLQADAFLEAVEEKGAGKLEHPKYGDIIVVPSGTITRRDDLTTGTNQAIFELTFFETIEEITFPTSTTSELDEINNDAETFQTDTASETADSFAVDNANEGAALQAVAAETPGAIEGFLSDLAEKNAAIKGRFDAIKKAYTENVKNVLDDALGVIEQAILLTRLPGELQTFIDDQINSFSFMIDNLIATAENSDGSNNPGNKFLYTNALAGAALTGLSEGCLNSIIDSRAQAVDAAETILNLNDSIILWQDQNITNLGLIDTGLSFTALQSVVNKTAKYLISSSFNLPTERRQVLQNDRNIFEYLASVGLNVETDIDTFIKINDLTADEIEILPAGKEVVYYE